MRRQLFTEDLGGLERGSPTDQINHSFILLSAQEMNIYNICIYVTETPQGSWSVQDPTLHRREKHFEVPKDHCDGLVTPVVTSGGTDRGRLQRERGRRPGDLWRAGGALSAHRA